MKPKKSSAISSSAKPKQPPTLSKVLRPQTAMGVPVMPEPTFDVRHQGVAIQYPYMFANTLDQMGIFAHWNAVFRLTCLEIDIFLGENKRRFHWRQLDIEDGQPHWYWSLGKDYDHHVLVFDQGAQPSAVIVKSAADARDELREGIRAIVDTGMRRTAFFSPEASNSGEL